MSAGTEVVSRVELDRDREEGPSPPGTLRSERESWVKL
jgi:hypothetical protein